MDALVVVVLAVLMLAVGVAAVLVISSVERGANTGADRSEEE